MKITPLNIPMTLIYGVISGKESDHEYTIVLGVVLN